MAEESPTIRWHTICLAACWVIFLVGSARVTSAFREMFVEMHAMWRLPALTRVFLAIPAALWIGLGLLVAAGLLVKSRLMSARASRVVDMVSVVVLLAAGAAEVIALFLPLVEGSKY